ncbi:hypothetical protein B0I35DRAFT_237727 [Stachybotrys elegans]|uniref:Uncharacterized protein n=1 Tax=Stachybotrys elegans TaxID=80388 RepID=A0A8K0SS80_9HYPO|nr:hypothetical protein B0I35DRAFT_237727 [Stachybotrys elegans]
MAFFMCEVVCEHKHLLDVNNIMARVTLHTSSLVRQMPCSPLHSASGASTHGRIGRGASVPGAGGPKLPPAIAVTFPSCADDQSPRRHHA